MRRWRILSRVRRIIDYIPILWKDEDCTFDFSYALLYKKLSRMEKVWEDRGQLFAYVGQEKDLRDIRLAKNLCKRLHEDKYLENALFWHDKKYGDYVHLILVSKEPNENGRYYYPGDPIKKREAEFSRCCEHSDKMKMQDRDLLMDLLKKKSIKWWI